MRSDDYRQLVILQYSELGPTNPDVLGFVCQSTSGDKQQVPVIARSYYYPLIMYLLSQEVNR